MDAQAVGGKQEPAPTVCCHVDMQASFFVGFFSKKASFSTVAKRQDGCDYSPNFLRLRGKKISSVQAIQIRLGDQWRALLWP